MEVFQPYPQIVLKGESELIFKATKACRLRQNQKNKKINKIKNIKK